MTVDSVTSITTVTKYYFAGTQRIAMRKGGVLTYMLTDHLGSTSLITDSTGAVISETRYTAWGEVRYQAGTTSTGYGFTGQYSNTADFELMQWRDQCLKEKVPLFFKQWVRCAKEKSGQVVRRKNLASNACKYELAKSIKQKRRLASRLFC